MIDEDVIISSKVKRFVRFLVPFYFPVEITFGEEALNVWYFGFKNSIISSGIRNLRKHIEYYFKKDKSNHFLV
jgi:hypothetical protein